MCRNCYIQYMDFTKKDMLMCKLFNEKGITDEREKLCVAQRYCDKEDKYIPHNQKQQCKYYVG